MTRKKFSIGTFNVCGLTSNIEKELLNKDIEKLCRYLLSSRNKN